MQCGKVFDNGYLKLRIFNNSLTGVDFVWYINLPLDSIETWDDMEEKFRT